MYATYLLQSERTVASRKELNLREIQKYVFPPLPTFGRRVGALRLLLRPHLPPDLFRPWIPKSLDAPFQPSRLMQRREKGSRQTDSQRKEKGKRGKDPSTQMGKEERRKYCKLYWRKRRRGRRGRKLDTKVTEEEGRAEASVGEGGREACKERVNKCGYSSDSTLLNGVVTLVTKVEKYFFAAKIDLQKEREHCRTTRLAHVIDEGRGRKDVEEEGGKED